MKKIIGEILKQKIERLKPFEERMQIKMENFSVKVNDNKWVRLFCEIHPVDGTTINSHINIECILYNKEGAIIEKDYANVDSEEFLGFDVIEFNFQEDGIADEIGRIRIYPKKI